jgi:hypothetical protein
VFCRLSGQCFGGLGVVTVGTPAANISITPTVTRGVPYQELWMFPSPGSSREADAQHHIWMNCLQARCVIMGLNLVANFDTVGWCYFDLGEGDSYEQGLTP